MKKTKLIFKMILTIYIILPLIIFLNPALFKYKFIFLTVTGIIFYFLLKVDNAKNEDLGIKKENILVSLKRNIPLIISCIVIIFLMNLLNFGKYLPNETIYFYLFYIFISCPIQEFLYRGMFGYFDKKIIKNSNITSFLSSFCYSFVHIIYKDVFTCTITFIIGLIWYKLYSKDYNLFGVCLSHCILGILTIYLGLIN